MILLSLISLIGIIIFFIAVGQSLSGNNNNSYHNNQENLNFSDQINQQDLNQQIINMQIQQASEMSQINSDFNTMNDPNQTMSSSDQVNNNMF